MAMMAITPFILVVNPSIPAKTANEFIQYAKERPGKLSFSSANLMSAPHLAGEMFQAMAGVKLTHVPYAGAQAAYQDVLGGRVDLFFDNASTALPQVNGGAVRALAVSSAKRYAVKPELPTVMETGVAPIDVETWFGLFAPAATPAPALAKLRDAVDKARALPDVVELFGKTGGAVNALGVSETEAFVRREAERWGKVVREAGIRAE